MPKLMREYRIKEVAILFQEVSVWFLVSFLARSLSEFSDFPFKLLSITSYVFVFYVFKKSNFDGLS